MRGKRRRRRPDGPTRATRPVHAPNRAFRWHDTSSAILHDGHGRHRIHVLHPSIHHRGSGSCNPGLRIQRNIQLHVLSSVPYLLVQCHLLQA